MRALQTAFAGTVLALVFAAAPVAMQAQPQPSASPAASATPEFRFVLVPTPGPSDARFGAPEIRQIALSDGTIVSPALVRVRVTTNADVVSVVARTLGRELSLPLLREGVFGGEAYVSSIPEFLRNRTYDIEVIAAVRDGRTTSAIVPLTIK